MKISYFWGELTDISAKKEGLFDTQTLAKPQSDVAKLFWLKCTTSDGP